MAGYYPVIEDKKGFQKSFVTEKTPLRPQRSHRVRHWSESPACKDLRAKAKVGFLICTIGVCALTVALVITVSILLRPVPFPDDQIGPGIVKSPVAPTGGILFHNASRSLPAAPQKFVVAEFGLLKKLIGRKRRTV